jgi:hypothetical protein
VAEPRNYLQSPVAISANSFHEKGGRSQESFVFTSVDSFLRAEPPLSPFFHPQSVMSDSRSLQGGRTQCSRCCYLIIDLAPIFWRGGGGQAFVAVTYSRRMSSAVTSALSYATAALTLWLFRSGS